MGAFKETFGTCTELSTLATNLASMVRADFDSSYPFSQSLVFDKSLELVKAPSVQPEVELSSFISSDSFQIFYDNHVSCYTIANDCFADVMVSPSFETSLFSRNFLQEFSGASSAFSLKLCSQPFEFDSILFDFFSAKKLFFACYSDVVYSNVNTDGFAVVTRNISVDISRKSDVDEQPFLSFYNLGSLIAPIKILPIVFRNFNRNIYSSFNCCKPYLIKAKSESSSIKRQGKKLFKNWFASFIRSDAFKGLTSYPVRVYDELARKVKLFSRSIIAKVVKLVPVISLRFETFISDVTNSLRILFHSVNYFFSLRNLKLYRNSCLHNRSDCSSLYIPYAHTCRVSQVKISDAEKKFPEHSLNTLIIKFQEVEEI